MAGKAGTFRIDSFGAVSTLTKSNKFGTKLSLAKNIILRPWGGFRGIPIYERLWALGSTRTMAAEIALLHPPQCPVVAAAVVTFAAYANSLANDEVVRFSDTAPVGFSLATDYYVKNRTTNSLQLSATLGGHAITPSSSGSYTLIPQRFLTSTDKTVALRLYKHGKNFLLFYDVENSKCRGLFYLGDDGSHSGDVDLTSGAPSWETLAINLDNTARWNGGRFFSQLMLQNGVDTPVCVQLNRTATPGKWRKQGNNAKPATPSVSLASPSSQSNTQASWTIPASGTGSRTGGVALTFVAHSTNFPGAAGNTKIYVRITYASYATAITSTLTGSGTTASPYHYTITTGAGASNNSNDAIKAFVNTDTKVISILSCQSAANATADTQSWALTALSGGAGTGVSTGWSNRTVSVYARYWDEGQENLGYEGISSDKSNVVIIDALSANDIVVSIVKSPYAGTDGRFTAIRLYLQFGEDTNAIWQLVDPDNPIDNTTAGTATVRIGSETLFGQTMYVDQHQILPTNHIVQVNGQMWHGGDPSNPERLYPSKPATEDELAPEGANVDAYEILQATGGVGGNRITALYSDNFRLHAHTRGGVSLIDPANPTSQQQPPSLAGAINASAITPWTGSDIYYLGSDLQLYQFNGSRYGKRDVEFASAEAALYVMERVDKTAIANHPERVFMFPDVGGQMLWFFVPARDGTLKGFAYDFLARGIVGEFDYPKIYAATRMEPDRPEFVFADEDGNLFVWDTSDQPDHGDAFAAASPFTEYASPDTAPTGDAGFGHVTWAGKDYRRAYIAELETGMLDLGKDSVRKQWIALIWGTIARSRAKVEVTITLKSGQTITRMYGDVGSIGNQGSHKIMFSALATAIKIKLRILSAEQLPWAVREMSVDYRTGAGV